MCTFALQYRYSDTAIPVYIYIFPEKSSRAQELGPKLAHISRREGGGGGATHPKNLMCNVVKNDSLCDPFHSTGASCDCPRYSTVGYDITVGAFYE